MSYKVTAELVIIAPAEKSDGTDSGNSGPRYFYREAVIPDGFNDERCKVLVDEGMLEKLSAAEEKSVKADAKAAEKTAEKA